jgi:hypothetical protein
VVVTVAEAAELTIDCAPFIGVALKTDSRKVHQSIHSFVQGGTAKV